MERLQYGIKNSRIWYLCTFPRESNEVTLDNWTRYSFGFKETYYINDKTLFLEVNHFEKTFKFHPHTIRKSNEKDFRLFFNKYLDYEEIK